MLNFIVCFINEFKQNTKFLEDNFMEIMGIFFTLYIGLVAFVYPKIIDTKEKIKNISQILVDKLDKVWYIKDYLILIISILSIDFILFYLFKCQFWFILLNIIISVIILLISCFVFKKLEEFLFKPTSFLEPIDNFNFENEKDLEKVETNLELCKDLIIDTVATNNNYSYYYLNYIENLFNIFINKIKGINNYYYIDNIKFKCLECFLNDLNDLNQETIKNNKIHILFIKRYYNIIQLYANKCFEVLKNKNNNLLIHFYSNLIDYYKRVIAFIINHDCFMPEIHYPRLKSTYEKLIKLEQQYYNNTNTDISFRHSNNIISYIVEQLLNHNNTSSNILLNRFIDEFCCFLSYKQMEKFKYYSINLIFSLLCLLYYYNNYKLFKQLFDTNKELQYLMEINILFSNLVEYKFFDFPNIITNITLNTNNTNGVIYKYFIVIIMLIRIKDYSDKERMLLFFRKKNSQPIENKKNVDNFSNEFKNNLEIKKYYSEHLNNIKEKINKSFEEILNNTEFCQIMNIDINKKEEYRKFIDEKLNKLEEIVKSNE